MKIDAQTNLFRINHPENRINAIPDPGHFDELLKRSLNAADPATEIPPDTTAPPQHIAGPSIVPFSRPQSMTSEQLVEKMAGLLQVLDDYARKLEDHRIDMHDIHPLIGKIKKEAENLDLQFNQLNERHELKNILESVLQTTAREIKNFENGDYLA